MTKEEEVEYRVYFIVHAATSVQFSAPPGLNSDQVMKLIDKKNLWPCPDVCHQCSDEIEVGDLGDEVEILCDHKVIWSK